MVKRVSLKGCKIVDDTGKLKKELSEWPDSALDKAIILLELNKGQKLTLIDVGAYSYLEKKETIKAAFQLHNQGDCLGTVVSLSKVKTHPAWCFQLGNESTLRPLSKDDGFTKRAQDLETFYGLNGLIYVMNQQELRATKKIIGKKTKVIVVDPGYETLDIDTQDDFDLAEFYLAKRL